MYRLNLYYTLVPVTLSIRLYRILLLVTIYYYPYDLIDTLDTSDTS